MRTGAPPNRDRRQQASGVVVNEQIREPEVRLLGEDKGALGIVRTQDALEMARDLELDLIMVVPDASPPVMMELSKYYYELTKAAKDAKKKQRESMSETKELKFRPGTDIHDYQTKLRAAQRFLAKGNKVKITLQFRGREVDLADQGRDMCNSIVEDLSPAVVVESPPSLRGRTMSMALGPRKDV